jgi:hypothetical protein
MHSEEQMMLFHPVTIPCRHAKITKTPPSRRASGLVQNVTGANSLRLVVTCSVT